MGLSDFLASIAGNYTKRYLERVNQAAYDRSNSPSLNSPSQTSVVPATQPTQTDCYEPSNQALPDNKNTATEPKTPPETTSDNQPSVEVNPDGTYYYKRQAQLDYKMDLRFNLSTLISTVESLAEGDTEAVERFVAAGFGLKADFDVQGQQTVETNLPDETTSQNSDVKSLTSVKSRQAGQFKAQSKNFLVQSFMNEATDIRRSLDVEVQDNHRKTVNKIAFRYRLDNRFSFAFAERFNVQTRQLAGETSETLNGYFDSAGNLAESGTPEMIATFFDAVEGYLTQTEEKLTANAENFFNTAAAELGFSGELVETTASMLTGTIENFFDRVTSAVAALESKLIPGITQSTLPSGVTSPVTQAYTTPTAFQNQAYLAEA